MDINEEKVNNEKAVDEADCGKTDTKEKSVEDNANAAETDIDTEDNEEEAAKKDKKNKKSDKKSDEIKKLKDEYAALNDRYMRTLAEYDNFRKRTQKDLDSRASNAKIGVLEKILPVVDNFERAAFNSDVDFDNYKKGIEMTVKQLLEILSSLGVESFGEKGDAFDPNIHNAVMHVEDENAGENEVVDIFMKGYKIGDKIIRPATVKVAN
ncbi:MAG: nucleotide exchange factor GrpE [Clostridiales bacterium]|nr:nucleotide exchange factor GrpE [Clostridiales bacterium]